MIIKSADFFISSGRADQCPQDSKLPEYAFIGRSNVGKSSLINMLTGRKALAKTSSTPGKTMLINHFIINNEWYLVDLPGYGFARRGKKEMEKFRNLIEYYILERQQLTCLFVLIDSRLSPQKIDLEFIQWLGEEGIPFCIVFTKADKNKTGELKKNVQGFLKKLQEEWEELPAHFVTSSEKGTGRMELLDYIDEINNGLDG
ncbi:ribosome biogenesis GTP-binding protein YihA/YsxC [Ihuprevotella massiliensis]|jgi:ribosome biogenesis GTP-binding protein ysxC|uniref:ribosome biogenesis GTP-binding protein YihA/YsxC n=1 Tax=Ihuprevotella massiliensis TaxID=1852368 RepID=UPI00094EE645